MVMKEKKRNDHVVEILIALVLVVGVCVLPGTNFSNKKVMSYPIAAYANGSAEVGHAETIVINGEEYVNVRDAKNDALFDKEIGFILMIAAVSFGICLGRELERRKESEE